MILETNEKLRIYLVLKFSGKGLIIYLKFTYECCLLLDFDNFDFSYYGTTKKFVIYEKKGFMTSEMMKVSFNSSLLYGCHLKN